MDIVGPRWYSKSGLTTSGTKEAPDVHARYSTVSRWFDGDSELAVSSVPPGEK